MHSERKLNPFTQKLFRNLKGYDYIINFLTKNAKLLSQVRNQNREEIKDFDEQMKIEKIRTIFKRCFRVLEGFCKHNKPNKK